MSSARLLIACPDRPGIVAAISTFLYERGANILDSAQHSTDAEAGTFFMRMEFRLDDRDPTPSDLEDAFAREIAPRFQMDWRLSHDRTRKRIGILVSRQDHCLLDLLWRWRRGDLGADIAHVVSNHADLQADVEAFGLPYTHIPISRDRKTEAEAEILDVFSRNGNVDLIVLARYMQILSAGFLERAAVPIINIHHSFLPAFVGADPYRRAHDRGVKIIGATAHYVTVDLDEGPIIEQNIERISHRRGVRELERIGRDIERSVLARAVQWHIDDRVIVHGNKTFVFD